jgi:hypothetical protein
VPVVKQDLQAGSDTICTALASSQALRPRPSKPTRSNDTGKNGSATTTLAMSDHVIALRPKQSTILAMTSATAG